jgi:hypothetical protein
MGGKEKETLQHVEVCEKALKHTENVLETLNHVGGGKGKETLQNVEV